MSARATLSFDSGFLSGLDDTVLLPSGLTAYEQAILMQVLPVLLNRKYWQTMTDAQWDTLSAKISESIGKVQVT